MVRDFGVVPAPPMLKSETKSPHPARHIRREGNCLSPQLEARVVARHDVDGSTHSAEVDSFGGRASLDVVEIAAERGEKELATRFAVLAMDDRREDHFAQGRSMRSPCLVVLDVSTQGLLVELVAEPCKQASKLFRAEEIEEHDHVRLLRCLEAIRCSPFGLEDAIQPLDGSIALGVSAPVEVLEVWIALELADDAVVKCDGHSPRDVVPAAELGLVDVEHVEELASPLVR